MKRLMAALAFAFLVPASSSCDVDAVVQCEMKRLNIPALSIAILRDGAIVFSKAYGLADVEDGARATPATRFRTASVAKSISATAVMKLVEEGRIKLDEPIQTYCSAYPQKDAKVTVRHLLTHTSGVRHYQKQGESRGMEHFLTVRESLALFKDDPLLFAPGTKFGYSTYGFSLLGCAIEGATGLQFDDYVRDHVFAPAGMRHTAADHHFFIISGRARPYSVLSEEDVRRLPPEVKRKVQAGQLVNAWFHDTSMKRPGGGLLSTAEDLVRFAWAFQKGELVSGETVRAMWSVQRLNDGTDIITPWGPLGLGWFVNKTDKPRRVTSSGGQIGGRASINVYPDDGIVFAIMTNLSNADISAIEGELRTYLGLPESQPRPIRD